MTKKPRNRFPKIRCSRSKTLNAISAGKTLITITHRLKAMEQYDRILVLEKGIIVEQGMHGELMAGNGLYRRMWELQHVAEIAG